MSSITWNASPSECPNFVSARNFFASAFALIAPKRIEVVIVHARQIVVDQRIGVDAFHGARQRKCGSGFSPAAFSSRQTKNRAQPLAAGEKRITHRFVDGWRQRTLFRQKTIECAIDHLLSGFQVGGKVHDDKGKTGLKKLFMITMT